MQLQPRVFWRLTLAEWRAVLSGYADRLKMDRRGQAWTVSHLLIAAGCEPDAVTPAKLLGEPTRQRKAKVEQPQMPIDELWRLVEGKTDGKV